MSNQMHQNGHISFFDKWWKSTHATSCTLTTAMVVSYFMSWSHLRCERPFVLLQCSRSKNSVFTFCSRMRKAARPTYDVERGVGVSTRKETSPLSPLLSNLPSFIPIYFLSDMTCRAKWINYEKDVDIDTAAVTFQKNCKELFMWQVLCTEGGKLLRRCRAILHSCHATNIFWTLRHHEYHWRGSTAHISIIHRY